MITTACLPHTQVSKINKYLWQCFENCKALHRYAIPWLNRILWGTWFHQHLIPMIVCNRKWSWEKDIRRSCIFLIVLFPLNVSVWPYVDLSWSLSDPLMAWVDLCSRWVQPRNFLEISIFLNQYQVSALFIKNFFFSFFNDFFSSLWINHYANKNTYIVPVPFQSLCVCEVGQGVDAWNDTLLVQYLKPSGQRSHGLQEILQH